QSPEKIISQIETLVADGVQEIVLTGIHTGGYGYDFDKYKFADLLNDIKDINGLMRVRISSIEISQLDEEVIGILRNNNVFAKHLHIPIQSASDQILMKMKRKYTVQEFKNKISEIRKELGDIAITTDIIVGYPEETEEIFEETLNNLKDINFSDMHVFPYSKRDGTPAAKVVDQVEEDVKKKRVKTLVNLSEEQKLLYEKKFIDRNEQIVIERLNSNGYYEGYSSNYIKLLLKSDENILNKTLNIKIKSVATEENICEKIS
ncbi:MAG: MiaB/RimO family radical SAM methylthiotransferase, partial [Bacilli bacterium]